MRRLSDIEEILWISAPELILLAGLSHSFPPCSGVGPLALELLLDCGW